MSMSCTNISTRTAAGTPAGRRRGRRVCGRASAAAIRFACTCLPPAPAGPRSPLSPTVSHQALAAVPAWLPCL
jgi:hypothetical protein